jgi:hypothetical protein
MAVRDLLPQSDSLQGYERARTERLYDGLCLEYGERHFGAVYLLGYSVEMTLKIAYFRLRGYGPAQSISGPELHGARTEANNLGIAHRHEGFHGLLFWADLLIRYRAGMARAFEQAFSIELMGRAHDIHNNWKVEMRYSHVELNGSDFRRVCNAALWFEENSERLWR